jgi:hypothetical protein
LRGREAVLQLEDRGGAAELLLHRIVTQERRIQLQHRFRADSVDELVEDAKASAKHHLRGSTW